FSLASAPPRSILFPYTTLFRSELALKPAGYHRPLWIYNTGGWVVDSLKPAPLQGGAVILIDEALNVASLRVYNQAADASSYRVGDRKSTRLNSSHLVSSYAVFC